MKIAILQPNYIPWKGVFNLIDIVDVFVFFDDVQYTKKDWRNRNKIKTYNGEIWLTVPVLTKGVRNQLIKDVKIDSKTNWQTKHYKAIELAYKKAPYFSDYKHILDEIYLNNSWESLVELNVYSTKLLAKTLGIESKYILSSSLDVSGAKDGERVVEICNILKCNYFINGPASKSFMNQEIFDRANITLDYIEYSYKEYDQLYPPFNHFVSVLDLLFNCGDKARNFILST
tara:strand:- start:187 stop:876 length:690 start_codon:yes stop_codon:yes gene_type:complete